MKFRWSDVVAMSAITAGAIVPTALLMADFSDHPQQTIHVVEFHSSLSDEAPEETVESFERTFEVAFLECIVEGAAGDAERAEVRALLGDQVDMNTQEIEKHRRHRRKRPPCRRPGRRHPGR
jgi:hypothetical protein